MILTSAVKSIIILAMIIAPVYASADAETDDIVVNVSAHSRRIQLDGFLLEWNRGNAKAWGKSPLMWDAAITPEGIAGYFSSSDATQCSSWTFKINTVDYDNDRAFKINVPEEVATGYFAFDKDTFEKNGAYNTEWLIPWDAFTNDDVYVLVADAAGCGDDLQSLLIFINKEKSAAAGLPYYYVLIAGVGIAAGVVAGKKFRKR